MKRSLLLCTIAALSALATPVLRAQADAPPVDINQLLQELKKMRDQNENAIKLRRNEALQRITSAAASPSSAVQFWKEAVKNAQFDGAEKEGQKLAEWRDGEGDALNDKLCSGAVQLHLRWLALTLRHSIGEDMKTLLPQVIDYTKALQLDMAAADHFSDQLDKERERNDGKHGMAKAKGVAEDATVKKVHEQIMRMAVGGSPVARWLQLGDLLGDGGKKQRGGGNSGWEATPGGFDGIFNAIILPEFRANKDPRLLEYWDVVIKRETEKAAERKLDVDQRDWATVKYPSLRWQRAQDVLLLGQRNRAIIEMFQIVKSAPQHPELQSWIGQLEAILVPTPSAPAGGAAPSAPVTGAVPPPVAVPPATAPVPTATLVPTPPATATVPGVRR